MRDFAGHIGDVRLGIAFRHAQQNHQPLRNGRDRVTVDRDGGRADPLEHGSHPLQRGLTSPGCVRPEGAKPERCVARASTGPPVPGSETIACMPRYPVTLNPMPTVSMILGVPRDQDVRNNYGQSWPETWAGLTLKLGGSPTWLTSWAGADASLYVLGGIRHVATKFNIESCPRLCVNGYPDERIRPQRFSGVGGWRRSGKDDRRARFGAKRGIPGIALPDRQIRDPQVGNTLRITGMVASPA